MRIDIVNNLDIQPKFKSIFFKGNKNPFTFHLNQGSGHFAVKVNDTESLAFVQHIGRQVTIIPRSEGSLLITVEDVDLPESLPVTAELLISSVARLNLDTQGYLIEKGSATNMTVTALDSYGIEFDEDQYN
jgi:deoxycytidine triphosphate deaminase